MLKYRRRCGLICTLRLSTLCNYLHTSPWPWLTVKQSPRQCPLKKRKVGIGDLGRVVIQRWVVVSVKRRTHGQSTTLYLGSSFCKFTKYRIASIFGKSSEYHHIILFPLYSVSMLRRSVSWFLFHCTFVRWVEPFLWHSFKRGVTKEDLYPRPSEADSQKLLEKFN